jgi:O-antigen/teichoic acid export membrane protein
MFYNTSYQVLSLLLPLLVVPYVSRLLGATGIGLNTVTSAFAFYFVLFSSLGIQLYGNREIAAFQGDKFQRSKIFFELNLLQLLAVIISAIIFLIFVFQIPNYRALYLLQGVSIISVAFDITWYFKGIEDFRIIAVRNTIIKIISVGLIFLLVRSSNDLWLYIALTTFPVLLGNMSIWPFLRHELVRVPLRELHIFSHFGSVLLLFLPLASLQLYPNITKTMLEFFHGATAAGFYFQSDTIVRVAFTLVTSFSAVFVSRLSKLVADHEDKQVKELTLKSLNLSTSVSFLLVAGLMGVSNTFVAAFLGSEFKDVSFLLFIESLVILPIAWNTTLGPQFLLATRKMKAYTLAMILGLGANVILNFIVIPSFGALGAVIATVMAEIVITGVEVWYVRETFSLSELTKGFWKYGLAGAATFFFVFWLNQELTVSFLHYILIALLGTCVYIMILVGLRAAIVNEVRTILPRRFGGRK